MTVYQPFEQQIGGGRLFVHAQGDPYALVPMVTRIVRELASDQPVENAATLSDVRAEVLAPDRLNTTIFGLFAVAALAIAIVGVGGVLAFSVNGRLYGAFTCAQVDRQVEWTRPQLNCLRAVGMRVSLALANANRTPTDTQPALLPQQ